MSCLTSVLLCFALVCILFFLFILLSSSVAISPLFSSATASNISIWCFQNTAQKEMETEIWSAVAKWQKEAGVASKGRPPPVVVLDSTSCDSGISCGTTCNGFGSSHATDDTTPDTSSLSPDRPLSLVPSTTLSTRCRNDGSGRTRETRMVRSISSWSTGEEGDRTEAGETGCLARWGSSLTLNENRSWSRSNRNDMMKSFKPDRISKIFLKGVTTTEEVI